MIRVGDIGRILATRKRSAQFRQLDTLLAPERERVQAALEELPEGATVDIDKLIAAARRQGEKRVTQLPKTDPEAALRYFCSIASHDQLIAMHSALKGGASIAEVMASAHAITSAPCRASIPRRRARRSFDDDAGEDASRPRRIVRRKRLNSEVEEAVSPPLETPSSGHERAAGRGAPAFGPRVFGGHLDSRPFGCPVDADYDKWRNSGAPPPWDDEQEAAKV